MTRSSFTTEILLKIFSAFFFIYLHIFIRIQKIRQMFVLRSKSFILLQYHTVPKAQDI